LAKSEVGLIGLAVMGQNLALNMAGHGYPVAVYNRTVETGQRFVKKRAGGLPIEHGELIEDFVNLVKKPRTIIIMVKAGDPVDETIGTVAPLLEPGDLVMDFGNSHFRDTERRARELEEKGIEFMGVGVSGGEDGALKGPSIMPGGNPESYERVKPMLEAIAARTEDGPCVTYIGNGGAGHFVKMLHNGLEYGDMQLLAEAYDILRKAGSLDSVNLARAFEGYNKGPLASFLVEAAAGIFHEKDQDTGKLLLDIILDKAGQKGTGMWAAKEALELGIPTPTITAAVEARQLSAMKEERVEAERAIYRKRPTRGRDSLAGYLVNSVGDALYASKLALYAQGMALLSAGSRAYDYGLNIPEIARIWKGGCIIRSAMLDLVKKAYTDTPDLANLLLAPDASEAVLDRYDRWGNIVRIAIAYGIPVPAMASALMYFEAYRTARLPANLIQAMRDYFGAHTFQRTDREGSFHHEWKKKE
jgi:6-phosphogluconate dehydrogenase